MDATDKFKVVIVEDVPLELKGTEGILRTDVPEADVIGTAADEFAYWKIMKETLPDVTAKKGLWALYDKVVAAKKAVAAAQGEKAVAKAKKAVVAAEKKLQKAKIAADKQIAKAVAQK